MPEVSAGQLILFMILGLAIMVIAPFAKAGLLYLAIRIVKFRDVGYWRCLFCVLIGFGTFLAVEVMLIGFIVQSGQEFLDEMLAGFTLTFYLLVLMLVPVAEFIALLLFFKDSIGRTFGAVAIHYLFCIVAWIMMVLGMIVIGMVVGLASG
jgi:hypothetical protein